MRSRSTEQPPRDLDVAVIGAGIAGVYAAWRLRTLGAASPALADLAKRRSDNKLRVGLFEYANRIGGRLYSQAVPGVDGPPAELGGMRFLGSHRRVRGLLGKLGYDPDRHLRVLPAKDDRNVYYVRGQHFTEADWGRQGFIPPYRLEQHERGKSPAELLMEVVQRHRKRAGALRDRGFWNLLTDELSTEAYLLLREAGGYDNIFNNWNAAEAIPFFLANFAPGLVYYALNDGFQSLPLRTAEAFREAGGHVALNYRLHRLDLEGNRINLTFDAGDPTKFRYRRLPPGDAARTHSAAHVVLAMPRRSIELLDPGSFLFDDTSFQENLRTVLPQPAFKIVAAYRRPWWAESRHVAVGRSLTDLPIRRCTYWHTAANKDSSENSVLMVSYNDSVSVEFWAGLARQGERYEPPLHACPPGVPISNEVRGLSAPAAMVDELHGQLRELHGLSRLADPPTGRIVPPYVTLYRDWTEEPFGGGWHFWKIGADSGRVMQAMRHPIPSVPLYVCGEAWSRQQGWVEGALESADDVLENALHVPRPHWMHVN